MEPPLIRTLHVEGAEDGTTGGSHRSLHDLVIGLGRFGIAPTVLFNEDNPFVPRLRDVGIEVHVWSAIRRKERKSLSRLPSPIRLLPALRCILRRSRFLNKQCIDLVHLNNSPFVGYTDWLPGARVRGIPCVASMRGDATVMPSSRQRKIFRLYRAVVPVSHYVGGSPACLALGAERVTVIPNGVDLERLQAAKLNARQAQRVRDRLGLSRPQEILAVMAGTIRRWKGQLNVVQALTHLSSQDLERLKLVFAGGWGPGDQSYVDEIRSLIREKDLCETVELLGHRRDVPELFSAADVAVHASTTYEPFGLVVVEALAVGTPIIAAKGGGPTEILQQGGGLLHDPSRPQELADHLGSIINDSTLRNRLSGEAEKVAERYSIRRTRREMARLYHSILSRTPPSELHASA